MKRTILSLLFFIIIQQSQAQFNLIVNEFSQGNGGTKEFIELLVVGTRTCTDSTADIRNWIFDDQNGWYGGSGNGIAPGHYRFLNDANWQAVPFGSIILIYNTADQNGNIPAGASDPTDANHDYVYILPINNSLLEQNTSSPVSPSDPAFVYPASGYSPSGSWSSLGLANSGDAVIITDPANPGTAHFSILFGLSGGAGFQTPTILMGEVAGNKNCYLGNDQYSNVSAWTIGSAGTGEETPGAGNTAANIAWIASMRVQVAPAVPDISTIQPTCTAPTGTITVNSPVGAGYTYSIDGLDFFTTTSFPGLSPDTYTVTVSYNGCTTTAPVTIDPPPGAPAAPNTTLTQPTCTTPTGTITINSPAGPGYTYSIDGLNFFPTTSFPGLSPDTYTVTVSVGGCSSTAPVTIDPLPGAPPAPNTTLIQPTCTTPTGTINIISPVGAGYTYSIDGLNFFPTTSFPNLAPDTYTVTVSVGGCSSTAPATITPPPGAPPAPNTTLIQPTCITTTGTINIVSPAGAGYTYSIDGVNFFPTTSFPDLSPATYTVTVSIGGCSSTAPVTINPVPVIPAPDPAITQPTCSSPTGTITIVAPLGANYTYSINGTDFQASPVFNGLAPNSYPITVLSNTGCSSTGNAVISPVPNAPAAPAVNSPVRYCQDAAAVPLTATGTGILWYANATGGTGNATAPIPSTAAVGTTTYYVSQTAGGCESIRAAIDVIVSNLTVAPIIGNTSLCVHGSSATVLSNGTTGGNWSSSDPSIVTIDNNGNLTAVAAGTATITYTVSSGGCTIPVTTIITVADFSLLLSANPNPVDEGAAVILNTGSTNLYQVLEWLPSAVFTDQTATSQSLTVNDDADYYAIGQSADGCIDTAHTRITVIKKTYDVFVPNVFTPNNDGKNDLLLVYGNAIDKIDFKIFNQWGQLLFETNDKNKGWDGTYKGVMQPATVYVFVLKATMTDGSVRKKKGSITLIR